MKRLLNDSLQVLLAHKCVESIEEIPRVEIIIIERHGV